MSDYLKLTNELQTLARRLLEEGAVDQVIAYGRGEFYCSTVPLVIKNPEETQKLLINPFTFYNLVNILHRSKGQKSAVVVKGCDLKSLNQVILEKQINPAEVITIALDEGGTLDLGKLRAVTGRRIGEIEDINIGGDQVKIAFTDGQTGEYPFTALAMEKCHHCDCHGLEADYRIGEEYKNAAEPGAAYAFLAEYEAKTPAERRDFWNFHFGRCIRCFACRNVCPICYCTSCVLDINQPEIVPPHVNAETNAAYQLIRVQHGIGRCIDCGECERVCPMGLPLRLLTKALERDIFEDYNYKPGKSREELPPLSTYKTDDANGDFR